MARFPRPLTARETATLARLIEVQPDRWRSIYEAQARTARVESLCGCGCPTINLVVDAAQAERAGEDDRWEIAYAESPVGPIILLVNEGWLESLELLHWSGEKPPSEFPDADALTPHLRADP